MRSARASAIRRSPGSGPKVLVIPGSNLTRCTRPQQQAVVIMCQTLKMTTGTRDANRVVQPGGNGAARAAIAHEPELGIRHHGSTVGVGLR